MTCFFHREGEYASCELKQDVESPWFLLVVTVSGGDGFVARFAHPDDATEGWSAFREAMQENGWLGPFVQSSELTH